MIPIFISFFLLFSGDISQNLGPIQRSSDINSTIWEPLNKKDLHFLHITAYFQKMMK